jgi:hypothetical protein
METPQAEDLSNLIINFLPNDATDEELKVCRKLLGRRHGSKLLPFCESVALNRINCGVFLPHANAFL